MCTVSNKLKLCTCSTKDAAQLKYYWKLKRTSGKEHITLIGEPVLPADIGEATEQLNESLLLQLLNDGNCFDTEPELQQNDILELFFTLNEKRLKAADLLPGMGNFLFYTFRFSNGSWAGNESDMMDHESENFNTVQQGRISRPFK